MIYLTIDIVQHDAETMSAKIIVIGGGVGGLTAAALLAKAGYDVTVLEAHVYPGGCAGTFYHKGYRFDAGATLAGGFQPGGPHAAVAERLSIKWPISRVDPAWVVSLPDRNVIRWSDSARWQTESAAQMPELVRFWPMQMRAADVAWNFAARIPEWPPANIGDMLRLAGKVRPGLLPLAPLALTTIGSWLDRLGIRDRAARTFLDAQLLISAQVTAAQANALYGAVAIDLPRAGAYHVQGGIGGLAKTLASSLQAQGGRILYRRQATHIEVSAGRAVAVHTNKGERFEADVIIANVTPWALVGLLADAAPKALQKEVAGRSETWGAFTLYLGVTADILPTTSDHFQVVGTYDQPLGEGNSIFISLSDAHDPDRAPPGKRAITISTHTQIAPWRFWHDTDQAAYQARVTDYRDRLLNLAERVIPGLSRQAELILPGTPFAFEHFTRRPGGMVGGFPQTRLFQARGPHTGIANLWLVGDSVFPGQSTAGVTAGALRVAAEIKRDISISVSNQQPARGPSAAALALHRLPGRVAKSDPNH